MSLGEFKVSDFFVLRTPLLPVDEFFAWSQAADAEDVRQSESSAAASFDAVWRRLRAHLGAVLQRPEVQSALALASQDLVDAASAWQQEPDSKKGQRAELALVRYFTRMSTRPSPFGLFSGWTVGAFGDDTALWIAGIDSYRRDTHLDTAYIGAVAAMIGDSPEAKGRVVYYANETIYERAGRIRFIYLPETGEARAESRSARASPHAVELLRLSAQGATAPALARALVAFDPGVALDEATSFVQAMIDAGLLKSGLIPPITHQDSLAALTALCEETIPGAAVSTRLKAVASTLASIDGGGVRRHVDYRPLLDALPQTGAPMRQDRLVRANLVKPARRVTLGPEVIREIYAAIDVFGKIAAHEVEHEESLAQFRREFRQRYEGRHVCLPELFDEETGLRWGWGADGGLTPLLDRLSIGSSNTTPDLSTIPRYERIRRRLTAAAKARLPEVRLEAEDLGNETSRGIFPDSFHLAFVLLADSQDAFARGKFQLAIRGTAGPPGTRIFGRYCHSDKDLQEHVIRAARAEEALRPEAIFAEVVFAPPGSHTDIVARPALREYEIPFLGRSGVPRDRQLNIKDLWVCLIGERIVLYSRALGREVVPRLTTAHAATRAGNPSLYRFLASMGRLPMPVAPFWAADTQFDYIPRVVFGRLILSAAIWRLGPDDLAPILTTTGCEQFSAARELQSRLRWPRYIGLVRNEDALVVDLDNPLSIASLAKTLKETTSVQSIVEWLPGRDLHAVSGPEGRFAHEIIAPVVRTRRHEPPCPIGALADAFVSTPARHRTYHPGSEWCYLKLYATPVAQDQLVREFLGPLAMSWISAGDASRWFFVRYADPEPHLRFRVRLTDRRAGASVMDALNRGFDASHAAHLVSRMQYESYDREIERYGGINGIDAAERLFHADSECVCALMVAPAGKDIASRWRLAITGVDRLLDDLGLDVGEKLRLIEIHRDALWQELRGSAELRRQLAEMYRRERRGLERLLRPESGTAAERAAYDRRSTTIRQIGAELDAAEGAGALTTARQALCESFAHMHINRVLVTEHRQQELVISDLLRQCYASKLAVERRARINPGFASADSALSAT